MDSEGVSLSSASRWKMESEIKIFTNIDFCEFCNQWRFLNVRVHFFSNGKGCEGGGVWGVWGVIAGRGQHFKKETGGVLINGPGWDFSKKT